MLNSDIINFKIDKSGIFGLNSVLNKTRGCTMKLAQYNQLPAGSIKPKAQVRDNGNHKVGYELSLLTNPT